MPFWSGRCRNLHVERKIFGKASRKRARPVGPPDTPRVDAVAASEAAWSEFVNATGYVTVAARKPDWEELKKQLPPGTPKLDESALVAGAPFSLRRNRSSRCKVSPGRCGFRVRAGSTPRDRRANSRSAKIIPSCRWHGDDTVADAKWASASGWMDSCAEMMRLGEWVSKRSKR